MDSIHAEREVEEIIEYLERDVDTGREKRLIELLSLTRCASDQDLGPLFTTRGIRALGCIAFNSTTSTEYRPALRCLNNILVRAEPTRQSFVDEGYPREIIDLMKKGDPDDELPTAGLLLYCSIGTTLDLHNSFECDDLAGIVNRNVSRHARSISPPSNDPASAISATLKLLSTLSARYETQAWRFLESLHPILEMINKTMILSPTLQLPLSLLVNCLACIPIEQSDSFPESAADKLTDILQTAIIPDTEKENELMPLLMVLLRVAQSKSSAAQLRLRTRLLPSGPDRMRPLGQGASLPHRLLSIASTASMDAARLIQTLFLVLSNNDLLLFSQNVGFGNAAGLIASKGIQLSPDQLASQGTSRPVNPITGQFLDAETFLEMPAMTREEKEREAERLFVLFERLKNTGIVDVQNPVEQAIREGRFHDIGDDDRVEELD